MQNYMINLKNKSFGHPKINANSTNLNPLEMTGLAMRTKKNTKPLADLVFFFLIAFKVYFLPKSANAETFVNIFYPKNTARFFRVPGKKWAKTAPLRAQNNPFWSQKFALAQTKASFLTLKGILSCPKR